MGRKSLNQKENKYLQVRQELNLSRAQASELLECISEDRLEKIENERVNIHPEEVMLLAEKYKKPTLCNYFCSTECPIGKKYVPKLELTNIKAMTLDMLTALNGITKDKERFLEIVSDGEITKDELSDFLTIENNLDNMSKTIQTLKLWIENEIAAGKYN